MHHFHLKNEKKNLGPSPLPSGRGNPLPRPHPDLAPSNENFWVRPYSG